MGDSNKKLAVNVVLNKKDNVSNRALLKWVNETLCCNITNLEQLRTGAVYCQLLHSIFPFALAIQKVHFFTSLEFEHVKNFKVLQAGFSCLNVNKDMPVKELIAGKDHQEFLQWFYKFYKANFRGDSYNPMIERKSVEIGIPEPKHVWQTSMRSISVGSAMLPFDKPAAPHRAQDASKRVVRANSNVEEVCKQKSSKVPNPAAQRCQSAKPRMESCQTLKPLPRAAGKGAVAKVKSLQDVCKRWK